jgi:hypothetical protein
MKMIMTFIVACSLGVITTGCSTLKIGSGDGNKMVEIPDSKISHVPDWFFIKQTPDQKDIVVTATDISKDMQFAIDKATLNAKVQLAERLGTRVESITQESTLESGTGSKEVTREVDRVSKVKVKQELNFFTRDNILVVKDGDNFRAFVMLRLNNNEGRRLIQKDDKKSREDKLKELDKSFSDQTTVITPINPVVIKPAT